MNDLKALATVPLTRIPKVPFKKRLRIFFGKEELLGERIPESELDLPENWRAFIESVGAERAKIAAKNWMDWLFYLSNGTKTGGTEIFDVEASAHILKADAWAESMFELQGGYLDFKSSVSASEREALLQQVRRRYKPFKVR